MTQTSVFDRVAKNLSSFTKSEIKSEIKKDREWEKDDKYVDSCISDRLKRGIIIFDEHNEKYVFNKSAKKSFKSKGISDEEENEYLKIFFYNCDEIKSEFEKKYADFFKHPLIKMTDAFLIKSGVEELFDKLLNNSFDAATAQGAFNSRVDWTTSKTDANTLKVKAISKLKTRIKTYKSSCDYDKWHNNVCKELIAIYSGVKTHKKKHAAVSDAWTYGNSQKVLNLSIKYVVLITKKLKRICPTHKFIKVGEPFLEIINELHIPVDSYIIAAFQLWNKKHSIIYYPFATKWSKLNEEEYINYLPSLRSSICCPFAWETIVWPIAKILKLNNESSVRKYLKLI